MTRIELSVIVPTYESPTLAACLAAVQLEVGDRPDLEVIVAGSQSSIDSPRASLLRHVDPGRRLLPGAARNLGAEHASGRRLLFLDSDCLPRAGWLRAMETGMGDGAACAAIEFADEPYWFGADNFALFHEFLPSNPASRRPYLASYSLAVSAAQFRSVGGFDPALRSAEDLDLTVRLSKRGVPLRFLPAAVVEHRPIGRSGPARLLRHHFTYGRNSAAVRLRHPERLRAPRILRYPGLMAALGPAIALATTVGIYARSSRSRRELRYAPAVFLAKLAWCWSVAAGPRIKAA